MGIIGIMFLLFATVVAIDLGIRIVVYRRTKDHDVKHRYLWWEGERWTGKHSA